MDSGASGWRSFLRRHTGVVVAFAVSAALAFSWAVYVFLWFVATAQSTKLVPATLGFWSFSNLVAFILNAAFWELLLVGIPTVVGAVIGWLWWKSLPLEERAGYRFGRRSRSAGGSGGLSLLFFIGFCIKVYLDGNWNEAIATFSLNYVVGSFLAVLFWGLIILGIPSSIALVWWLWREAKTGVSAH